MVRGPNLDKKRARINIISHLLSQVPYKDLLRAEAKFPKRQAAHGYKGAGLPVPVRSRLLLIRNQP